MPATSDRNEEDPPTDSLQGILKNLDSALSVIKVKGIADKSEVTELQQMFQNPQWQVLAKVHDQVADSQALDQPVSEVYDLVDQFVHTEGPIGSQERELIHLLKSPHLLALFDTHDKVKDRQYNPQMPVLEVPFYPMNMSNSTDGTVHRTVGLHKSADQHLGITLKLVDGKVVIARILHGGLIHKQGLLQVGDQIIKVNQEEVGSMTPEELQAMLKGSSGSLVITVEPSVIDASFFGTQVYVRAHFDYNPKIDRLIPSKEAGLAFSKGDILEVLSQDDTFWWQACRYGTHSAAGLIPSLQLEERRKMYQTDNNAMVGCLGRRKPKRQLLYSSHHNGLFEPYDLILYEKMSLVPEFKRKTLILIGPPFIGRRQLKDRLVEDAQDKYAQVTAHTSKPRQAAEIPEVNDGYFHVTEESMKTDIQNHKFIEYGRHQQYLYGIKIESVLNVIEDGRIVVLDVYPQTIKMLRTPLYSPIIVFIKPSTMTGLKQLYQNVLMQRVGPVPSDAELQRCLDETAEIEKLYSPYFDATIINEDIDIAYEELLTTIKHFTTGPQWVPSGWVL